MCVCVFFLEGGGGQFKLIVLPAGKMGPVNELGAKKDIQK